MAPLHRAADFFRKLPSAEHLFFGNLPKGAKFSCGNVRLMFNMGKKYTCPTIAERNPMRNPPMIARRHGFLLLLLGLGTSVSVPLSAFGQETPQLISVTVDAKKQTIQPLLLRPNARTTVGFELKNPLPDAMLGVVVKLVDAGNNDNVLAQTNVGRIAGDGVARVVFAKAKEEKKEKAKDDKDKDKDTGEKIELVGTPTFKLQLWIEAQDPKGLVVKQDIDLSINEPRNYVDSEASFDSGKRRLSFKLNYNKNFKKLGGPARTPVDIEFGPEFVNPMSGTYSNRLTTAEPVNLFADNLTFIDPGIREGLVHITIDGYPRAYSYPVTLSGDGTINTVPRAIGARIIVPRYAKPGPTFPVALEVDGPLTGNYEVEVAIDPTGMKSGFDAVKLPGLRQQKVRLSYAPSGDLFLQADVRDWQTEFSTKNVFGNIWFRVSVYKDNKLVNLTMPKEVRPAFADQIPGTDDDSNRLYARVIQDGSAPKGITFVDLPKEWRLGKPLLIQAKVFKREEHQAPIDTVVFYKGKPAPDGKVDPDTILKGGEFDEKQSEALLQLPGQEAPGPMQVNVQFTTKTGVHGTASGVVNFKDYKGIGICKIKGNLAHGALGMAGRPVILGDAEGKLKDTAKTDGKGNFVFEKVLPGTYTLSSGLNYPALAGVTVIVVPEGVELIEGEKAAVKLKAKTSK